MSSVALVALWSIPVVCTAASPGDELNGKWQVTAMELRGMQLPAESIGPLKLAVLELGNGKLTIRAGDRVLHEGQYKVNAKASPKTIEGNLTPQTGRRDKQAETSTGIYEVEGDVLRVCFGAPGGGLGLDDIWAGLDAGSGGHSAQVRGHHESSLSAGGALMQLRRPTRL